MQKDNFRVEGIVRITVADKRTGRIKTAVEIRNTTLLTFASLIRSELEGTASSSFTLNQVKVTYIALGNSSKGLIKKLSGPTATETSGSGYVGVSFSVQDSSSDSYTVNYVSMGNDIAYGGPSQTDITSQAYFAQALSSPVTKNSTDVLNVSWEVRISYGSV